VLEVQVSGFEGENLGAEDLVEGCEGRRVERRVKRTSVLIWSREEVRVKMLVGEKGVRVEKRKKRVVRVRLGGRGRRWGDGRIGIPWMEGAARMDL